MRVRIFCAARSAMQSGRGGAMKKWRIETEPLVARLPEAMNGWVSSTDTLGSEFKLRFASRDEAESFARKNGWEITTDIPQERRVVPQSYMDNFRLSTR